MPQPIATISFASHRIETLHYAQELMQNHNVIILEEAPNDNFFDMLKKKISIQKYITEEGLEFPEFSKRYYRLLRSLSLQGKEIIPIEPYLEKLLRIHELFSEGKEPRDVVSIPALKRVYQAEKNAAKALFRYYESSLKGPFELLVETVKNFARHDAARFRIRDGMRAHAIAKTLRQGKKYYIETGGIHIFLVRVLRKIARGRFSLRIRTLMEPEIKRMTGCPVFWAPGDMLTMHYILQKKAYEAYEALWAARSIIYIKLLEKEEMVPSRKEPAPHVRDEVMINRLVSRLNIQQCGELYAQIRFQSRERALETAGAYLRNC